MVLVILLLEEIMLDQEVIQKERIFMNPMMQEIQLWIMHQNLL